MPRIHYTQDDYQLQMGIIAAHLVAYAVGVVWLLSFRWGVPVIALWSAVLAWHTYDQSPMIDGFQKRTYDRLRNKFGADWDLAATPHEFDLEREKAVLEYKRQHLWQDGGQSAGGVVLAWIICMFLGEQPLPLALFAAYGIGWLGFSSGMYYWLTRQLRATKRKVRANQKRASDMIPSTTTSTDTPATSDRLVIGSDGELLEIPAASSSDRQQS